MRNEAIEAVILRTIRSNYSRAFAAPTTKSLYKNSDFVTVDNALRALVADGKIRIANGHWFEVGRNEDTSAIVAARRKKLAAEGRIPERKVDNRKATKKPAGFRKTSAASRTIAVPGTE